MIANGEIGPFDQRISQVAREVGVLKIRFVIRPGREYDDARIFVVLGGELGEHLLHRAEERSQTKNLTVAEHIGQRAG